MENFPFKTKPYAHQLKCFNEARDKVDYAIFAEMRTGKTKMVIDKAAWLWGQGKIDGLLVVAPKGMYRDWLNIIDGYYEGQIVDHMPEHVKWSGAYWSSQRTKENEQQYKKLFYETEDLHILIMNVEALSFDSGVDFAEKFLNTHTTFMVIDESTTIKNKSKRTTNALWLGKRAKYRSILTGRPVTKDPLDLYYQCAFLNSGLLGFSSYFAFRNRYALVTKMQLGNRVFDKVVGYQRIDELTKKLESFSFRIRQDECSDIPEKMYKYIDVDLTPEQDKYYKQMKNMAIVQLSNMQIVTAAMVMTRLQKLNEIVCGFLRDPDSGDVTEIPNNRIDTVLQILEETDRKVIIWSNNTYDILKLSQVIGKEYGPESVAVYHGATGDNERQDIKRNFQNPDHPLRFFIGNPSTGKFGLTLTEAKIMIYYSNDYNLENRLQSEERSQFLAQKESLLVIDLITRGTVNEKIIKALRMKKELSDLTMGEEWRTWLD